MNVEKLCFYLCPVNIFILFVHNSMSVLKRPEGETLSALRLNQNIMLNLLLLLMIKG